MNTDIIQKVNNLKYKDDFVTLTNVYPSLLEEVFDLSNGITIIGGKDLDYYSETPLYHISGSAYYGTATITRKKGKKKTIRGGSRECIYSDFF